MCRSDAHVGAKIELRLIERHRTSADREVAIQYAVSDDPNRPAVNESVGAFPSFGSIFRFSNKRPSTSNTMEVTVTFPSLDELEKDYSNVLGKAFAMTNAKEGPLDKMGNTRVVLKTILGFGAIVAELHATAKLVVGLFAKAWEVSVCVHLPRQWTMPTTFLHLKCLEKAQGEYDNLKRLIGGLDQMLPFVELVRDRAKESVLKDTILALLYLVEDVSNFVINYLSDTNTVRTLRSLLNDKATERIDDLLRRFGELKESFDRGVGVQAMRQMLSIAQHALIDQLKPPSTSLDSKSSPCQEGTRTQVLDDIRAWYKDADRSQSLLWLYGQVGMGKSSISASVCQILHDEGALGAHFLFKRDDPYLRSPENMLNMIVYRLALQYEPYGRAVACAIEQYSGLLDMPLGQRYTQFVERPLRILSSSTDPAPGALVLVVDALDECKRTDSRGQLIKYLRDMSGIAPWLKVFVTSRPDDDIKATFGNIENSHVASWNLAGYDASADMIEYTRKRMNGIAQRKALGDIWKSGNIQIAPNSTIYHI